MTAKRKQAGGNEQLKAWRKALAEYHAQQRRQRARPRRDPLNIGPGMIRRPPDNTESEADSTEGEAEA